MASIVSYADKKNHTGEYTLDVAALYGAPLPTEREGHVLPLMSRALRVILSNEAMSRVNGKIVAEIKGDRKGTDVPTKEISDWREANRDKYLNMLAAARTELMADVEKGELGLRESGPVVFTEGDAKEAAAAYAIESLLGKDKAWDMVTTKDGKVRVHGQKRAAKIAAFIGRIENPPAGVKPLRASAVKAYTDELARQMARITDNAPVADDVFAGLEDDEPGEHPRRGRHAAE